MKTQTTTQTIKILATAFLLLMSPTLVWGATSRNYEEMGYDDLLNELTLKKQKLQQQRENATTARPLHHVGIGFANSFSMISTRKSSENLHASGIQLSAGTDLVSPQWFAEGIFRNYSPRSSVNEDFSLRELEAKVGFTNSLDNIWHYSISTGVSNRFLKYTNSSTNIAVDESNPSLVIGTSFFAQIHKNLSIGTEISGRTSMINSAAEQNSFDIALRLNTSL